MIRAFVNGITLDAGSQSAEITVKKLPEPGLASTGSSFVLVAGVRYQPATAPQHAHAVRPPGHRPPERFRP